MVPRSSARSLRVGLAAGVVHLLAVAAVWVWLSTTTTTPMGVADPAAVLDYPHPTQVWIVGSVVGLVLLGTVPAVLYLEVGLVTPSVVVVLWFVWATYRMWSSLHYSVMPIKWVPPLSLYAAAGSFALATVLLGSVFEWVVRRLGGASRSFFLGE